GPGIDLPALEAERTAAGTPYRHATLELDSSARCARLTVAAPASDEPTSPSEMRARGGDLWALAAFRELDDALLDLRFNHPEIGLLLLQTRGEVDRVLAADQALEEG